MGTRYTNNEYETCGNERNMNYLKIFQMKTKKEAKIFNSFESSLAKHRRFQRWGANQVSFYDYDALKMTNLKDRERILILSQQVMNKKWN